MNAVGGIPGSGTRMGAEREHELVTRACTDPDAFGELYDFYLPRIYGFLARRVAEESVIEDLVSTTFERAIGALRGGGFRNDSFGGWLYRVAANAAVDHVRRERDRVHLSGRSGFGGPDGSDRDADAGSGELAFADDSASQAFAAALDRDELGRALQRLPEHHRRVLVLRFYDDLEPEELAAVLGCSRKTLAVRVHRALAALRAALREESTDAA
jgi:RNA polymerase sigma-70 factor, ECF subfamily